MPALKDARSEIAVDKMKRKETTETSAFHQLLYAYNFKEGDSARDGSLENRRMMAGVG